MKNNVVFGVGGILIALLSADVSFAGCTMYEHANYDGLTYYLAENYESKYVGDDWNDQISSVKVSDDCNLTVWQHHKFQGDRRSFSSNSSYIGDLWNDQISSARCSCQQSAGSSCVMYQHANFDGATFNVQPNSNASYVGDS